MTPTGARVVAGQACELIAAEQAFEVVDAHHHLWDPDRLSYPFLDDPVMRPIRRHFGLDDLTAAVAASGVTCSVVVQASPDPAETEYLLEFAEASATIGAVVGWIDLASADGLAQLRRLQSAPGARWLAGVRAMAEDEQDPAWLAGSRLAATVAAVGAAGLVCDLLVAPEQLPAAIELVRSLPEVAFVLDHGGKPQIADGEFDGWARLIGQLAAFPNVVCKVSGLVTEADWNDWTAGQISPYVARLAEAFGSERLMFGSDWPVCLMAATYDEVFALAVGAVRAALGDGSLPAVFGANARRVYGIDPSGSPR